MTGTIQNMSPQEECERFKSALRPLFKAFIAFCDKHHLTWYCAYGTALGVARHQGFIPWDDDIDVFMPRQDYNRFLSLKATLRDTDYEILDWKDKGYFLDFAKFCDKRTVLIEREGQRPISIYIDVLTLDYYDEQINGWLKKHYTLYSNAWVVFQHGISRHSWKFFSQCIRQKQLSRAAIVALDATIFRLFVLPAKLIIKKFLNRLEKAPVSGQLWHYSIANAKSSRTAFQTSWFGEGVVMPFENFNVIMPTNYDALLSAMYGDYMKLPPVEKRVSHHRHYFVDFGKE